MIYMTISFGDSVVGLTYSMAANYDWGSACGCHCINCISFWLGGVPFIEQGSSTSTLPASDSAGSSISSPTTTDSGLDTCSKATSREDLSDLEQCSSSANTPSSALPHTESGSPDVQVGLFSVELIYDVNFENHQWFVFSLSICIQPESRQVEPAQSVSVESIPEVLEDKDSITEQSDSTSVHDMDYVNPRGVRFTQSTQRDGEDTGGL